MNLKENRDVKLYGSKSGNRRFDAINFVQLGCEI